MNLKHYNLGEAYYSEGLYDNAIDEFKHQIQVCPTRECYGYIAIILCRLAEFEESLMWAEKALDPELPTITGETGHYHGYYYNLGSLNYIMGDNRKSIEWYNRGLEIEKQLYQQNTYHDFSWGVSLPLLKELCSGLTSVKELAWTHYSSRFFHSGNTTPVDKTLPRWTGVKEYPEIIVLSEQGYGDRLQFGRYLGLLKDRFKKVWVHSVPETDCLFQDYHCTEWVEASTAQVAVPMADLANIYWDHAVSSGWLKNKFNSSNVFKKNGKLNVVIEYEGNVDHGYNHFRNCDVAWFEPLSRLVNLYNIRPGAVGPDWITYLNSDSWKTSCEYINGCDLVISVDTSLVHLAGSLNKPCWMLEPWAAKCWRWGNQELGTKNWWYPTVEVIRNPRDWGSVFNNVITRLEQDA
jgi:tetratricopeptide (TPR) repeat protein